MNEKLRITFEVIGELILVSLLGSVAQGTLQFIFGDLVPLRIYYMISPSFIGAYFMVKYLYCRLNK